MLAEERYQKIYELLQSQGIVTSNDLTNALNVSYETVRRDLSVLESRNLLKRTHGGAMLINDNSPVTSPYLSFKERETQMGNFKTEIAKAAIPLINENDFIALDSGTTAFELANEIKKTFHSLTVVTNSLATLKELSDNTSFTLISTGGIYQRDELSFASHLSSLIISSLNIDTYFLSVDGISADRGITFKRMAEVFTQQALIAASKRVVVIADHSKIGTTTNVKMCDLSRIDTIITDSLVTDDQTKPFLELGIQVVIAEKNSS